MPPESATQRSGPCATGRFLQLHAVQDAVRQSQVAGSDELTVLTLCYGDRNGGVRVHMAKDNCWG